MKVELENILDIGTELYSLDENFKIKEESCSEYTKYLWAGYKSSSKNSYYLQSIQYDE